MLTLLTPRALLSHSHDVQYSSIFSTLVWCNGLYDITTKCFYPLFSLYSRVRNAIRAASRKDSDVPRLASTEGEKTEGNYIVLPGFAIHMTQNYS